MPRYEQQKQLMKMVEETSLLEVIYDLAVVCHVKSDDAKERNDAIVNGVRWQDHAQALECLENLIRENDAYAERRKKHDEEHP